MHLRPNLARLRKMLALGQSWLPAGGQALSTAPVPRPSSPTDGFRYEIKFTCGALEQPALEAEFRCLHALFRPVYAPRRVNSIYFDSPGYRDLYDNVSGLPDRSKLRLRWYGSDPAKAMCTLEYKAKQGLLGTKQSVRLSQPLDLTTISWRALRAKIAEEPLGSLEPIFLESNMATALISYERDYYVSASNEVRLTVDRSIETFAQIGRPTPNLHWKLTTDPVIVAELKADAHHRDALVQACNEFPLRPSAHSKYTTAMLGLITEIA